MEIPQTAGSFILAGTIALAFRSKALDWAVSIYGLSLLIKLALEGVPGPAGDAWVFGMGFSGLVVKFWNYVLIMEPEQLAWKRGKGEEDVLGGNAKPSGTSAGMQARIKDVGARLANGLDLMLVARGIGREFEIRGIYQHKTSPPSKTGFVVRNAWAVFWRSLVLDLIRHFFLSTRLAGLQPLKGPLDYNIWIVIAFGALCWQTVRWKMDLQYRMASILGVLVGWGKPSDWPPIFGSWSEAWTIRRVWSRACHHNMRLSAEPPANLLARKLCGPKSKTRFAGYVRLVGVFLISCMVHVLGRSLAGCDVKVDYLYFGGQVGLIALEDCVQNLAARSGLINPGGNVGRAIGFVWTFIVQSWTLSWWVDGLVRKGWLAEPINGVSIVDSVLPRVQEYFSTAVR